MAETEHWPTLCEACGHEWVRAALHSEPCPKCGTFVCGGFIHLGDGVVLEQHGDKIGEQSSHYEPACLCCRTKPDKPIAHYLGTASLHTGRRLVAKTGDWVPGTWSRVVGARVEGDDLKVETSPDGVDHVWTVGVTAHEVIQ